MSQLTITNFRNNIYNIIDRVIDTGIPKTIESVMRQAKQPTKVNLAPN